MRFRVNSRIRGSRVRRIISSRQSNCKARSKMKRYATWRVKWLRTKNQAASYFRELSKRNSNRIQRCSKWSTNSSDWSSITTNWGRPYNRNLTSRTQVHLPQPWQKRLHHRQLTKQHRMSSIKWFEKVSLSRCSKWILRRRNRKRLSISSASGS